MFLFIIDCWICVEATSEEDTLNGEDEDGFLTAFKIYSIIYQTSTVGEDANFVGSVYQYQTSKCSCFMMARQACSRGMSLKNNIDVGF